MLNALESASRETQLTGMEEERLGMWFLGKRGVRTTLKEATLHKMRNQVIKIHLPSLFCLALHKIPSSLKYIIYTLFIDFLVYFSDLISPTYGMFIYLLKFFPFLQCITPRVPHILLFLGQSHFIPVVPILI